MGKFTVHDEPWIDEVIQYQLDIIVEIINKNVPNVKSIILVGGFGRGEGSVQVIGNNAIPLKDYDILVVVNKKPNSRTIRALHDEIYTELKISNPQNRDFLFSDFVADVSFIKKDNVGLFPDIATCEFKAASILLYGEDLRETIPLRIEDIPLSSGLRFLFEKTTGLIGHFSQGYLYESEIEKHKKELLLYECYKTYVEIGTSLCLLMKCYKPSFAKRMELFKEKFKMELPDLCKKIPDLPEWVIKTTQFKLKPRFEDVKEDPIDLWFRTRDFLSTVLEHYLEVFLATKINNWIDSYAELCVLMRHKYYKSRIEYLLSTKVGLNNKRISNLLNLLLQIYLGNKYTYQLLKEHKTLHLVPIKHFQAPLIRTYLTSPLILFSIKQDGKIDEKYFEEAKKRLVYLFPIKKIDERFPWNTLRKTYLKAYYACGGFR